MRKGIELNSFLVWMLLVIAFVVDDITTQILFSKGFFILESNPIYLAIPNRFLTQLILIFIYVSIGLFYSFVSKRYKLFYKHKLKGYKIYDLVVFLMSILVLLIFILKFTAGLSNTYILTKYSTPQGKIYYDNIIHQHQELLKINPDKHYEILRDFYNDFNKINALKFFLIVLGGYLLFRTTVRVIPSY